MSVRPDHFRRVQVADLAAPSSGRFDVLVDYWWAVTAAGELLFYHRGLSGYFGSPQCNRDRGIAERVALHGYPWPTTIQQLPVVYVPVWHGDEG